MTELVVATQNKGKVAEIAAALASLPVKVLALSETGDFPAPEENGQTFAENAILKATYYAVATGRPCLADDSGLEVDALDGAPGVYSARYAGEDASDADNNAKLLAALADVPDDKRTARFRCVLAYVDPDGGLITADGTCEGIILRQPMGAGGFGYDPLFFMPPLDSTLAEVSVAAKNAVSHRGQALRALAAKLERYYHENRRD